MKRITEKKASSHFHTNKNVKRLHCSGAAIIAAVTFDE